MSQPTLHTRTSSFFTSIQLEWVGSNLSIFAVCSPLISLLSLQIKYSGERRSPVHRSVNLQPAVTAFISCHENRGLKQTTLLQEKEAQQKALRTDCVHCWTWIYLPHKVKVNTEETCTPIRHLLAFTKRSYFGDTMVNQDAFKGQIKDSGLR